MRVRCLVVSIIALAATTAAAEPIAYGAPTPAGSGALAPLALTPPAGPLLAGVEGAADTGAAGILYGALYGGLAGAVVGLGIGLIESNNYGRDIAIGAGVGIVIGAALGATHAFGDARPLPATDGLGSTDRDPVLSGPRYVSMALEF